MERDHTDNYLRRIARSLGYKGYQFPMTIAEVLIHPNRPGDFTVLCYDGERRRDAATRLRNWSQDPQFEASAPKGQTHPIPQRAATPGRHETTKTPKKEDQ